MPATKITAVKVNAHPSGTLTTSFAVADEEEGNYIVNTGREILLFQSGAEEVENEETEEMESVPVAGKVVFTDADGLKSSTVTIEGLVPVGPFSVPGYGETVEFTADESVTVAAIKARRP